MTRRGQIELAAIADVRALLGRLLGSLLSDSKVESERPIGYHRQAIPPRFRVAYSFRSLCLRVLRRYAASAPIAKNVTDHSSVSFSDAAIA